MQRTIEFHDIASLKGPNAWTYGPVLEAIVDIGELEEWPSNRIPGFADRLAAWMPSLRDHRCSYDVPGGFLRRLREGTWAAHVLEHVTLELQALAGMPGGFGRARETADRGVYRVVVTCWHDAVTRQALTDARDLVLAAMDDRPFDVAASVERLREMGDDLCLGPSTAAIVAAAEERSIPWIRLNDGNLVQLGYGKAQRRIWTAETEGTSAIAEGISRDKDLTNFLLRSCGVPVPEGRLVASAADAWEAAGEIGVPVVVKPRDANHGRGVFIGLSARAEIESAFAIARDEGSGVMVERFVAGDEHRLLVVGGCMVAAARGESAHVTGDGRSTVAELVESQLNTDPRRGNTEEHPLNLVRIDSAARAELSHQGFAPESVPAAGVRVLIQRNGNMAFDVTDLVHPEVADTAALAARIVGLDIAGIDLVAEDISRPLGPQRGAIVEVNAGPGLQFHLRPAKGTGRPVGRAIVDHLFAPGETGRIPVVGVAGSHGTTLVAQLVAHLLSLHGLSTGLACADGLYFGRRRVDPGQDGQWACARNLLMNRSLDAVVIENDVRAMAFEGLAYDRCQVGVVTGLDPDTALPGWRAGSPDDAFRALRTQVDVVLPAGVAVLNADDPAVAGMVPLCDGEVLLFGAGRDADMERHRREGGRAVIVRDGWICAANNGTAQSVARLAEIPLCRGEGVAADPVAVLASVGAAWALGLSTELMRTGLLSFVQPVAAVPA